MQRLVALDFFRGLMLVIITIDHFGGPLREFTWESLGFVSAAEGFVFLSGFTSGLVYGRPDPQGDQDRLSAAYLRAFLIFRYHVAILLLLLTLAWAVPVYSEAWKGALGLPYASLPEALLLLVALVSQPYLMDILPLYVLFLLATPLCMRLVHQGRLSWVLGGSFLLWLAVQWDLPGRPADVLSLQVRHPGYFVPLAWQLLFVIGCVWGYRHAIGKAIALPRGRRVVVAAVAVCLVLAAERHDWISVPFIGLDSGNHRPSLSWVRLLDFLLVAYLFAVLIVRYPGCVRGGWIAFIGRHSLQVFAWHIVILYLLEPFKVPLKAWGSMAEIAATVLLVASLGIPAWLHRYVVQRREAPLRVRHASEATTATGQEH